MPKKRIKLPKELKKFKDTRDFIFENIAEEISILGDLEKTSAERADRCGKWLNLFKKVVKEHEEGEWQNFVKKRFPNFKIRTAERYMKIARQANLDEYPALASMGKTQLYKLTALAGKKPLATFLMENGINVNIDIEEDGAIEGLRREIDAFIADQTASSEDRDIDEEKDEGNDEGDKEDDGDDEGEEEDGQKDRFVANFKKSATSFIKNVDLALNDKTAFISNQDDLSEIIKEVQEKLTALEEFKKSQKSKKAAKRRQVLAKKNAAKRKKHRRKRRK